jgi:hypothetical protein
MERAKPACVDEFNWHTFQYDPFGRRLAKMISSTTTNYPYDGINPVQEPSGSTVTANLLTGLGVDERFTRTDSSTTSNFLTDALGSTLALAGGSAGTPASHSYDPFGNSTTSGTSSSTYTCTGRESDATGLYFNRGRYYKKYAAREKRTLANLGAVLLEWSFEQLKAVCSTGQLLKQNSIPGTERRMSGSRRRYSTLCTHVSGPDPRKSGAPGGVRTPGLVLRRHTLYPSEVRARGKRSIRFYMGPRGRAKISPGAFARHARRAL